MTSAVTTVLIKHRKTLQIFYFETQLTINHHQLVGSDPGLLIMWWEVKVRKLTPMYSDVQCTHVQQCLQNCSTAAGAQYDTDRSDD